MDIRRGLHRAARRSARALVTLLCLAILPPLAAAQDEVIDLNVASQSELETLYGIGPVKAEGIIRYRQENGQFQHPSELLEVPGIGRRTLSQFCHRVMANGIRGCESPGALPPADSTPMPAVEDDGRLNINLASAEELQVLPRIGPAISQRIVDHREANGLFMSVESLDDVNGIGPATMDELRAFITIATNLNTASAAMLVALGTPPDVASAIVERRNRQGAYHSLDALSMVPGVDTRLLDSLRPFLYAGHAP